MGDRRLITFARHMRHVPTDGERKLWSRLRNRQLGEKFRRQHPIPPYVADFFCDAARLVVEVDGEQHCSADRIEYDERRTSFFESLGLRVVRFSASDAVKHPDAVARTIANHLVASPGTPGEG